MKVTIVVTKQTQTGIAIMPKNKFHMSSASVRSIAQFASQTPKARKKKGDATGKSTGRDLVKTCQNLLLERTSKCRFENDQHKKPITRTSASEQSPGLSRCSTTSSLLALVRLSCRMYRCEKSMYFYRNIKHHQLSMYIMYVMPYCDTYNIIYLI